jgi:hypothetical protein
LTQILPLQGGPKFGLADEKNLQNQLARFVDVGKEPKLLKQSRGQILRLVDDQQCTTPLFT